MTTPDAEGPPDSETLDSLNLVRRAQGGDDEAYEQLFGRYLKRVRGMVRARLGAELRGAYESSDLVQDTMMEAVRHFDRFEVRTQDALVGWFAKIVENRIRAANRHAHTQKRDMAREVPMAPAGDAAGAGFEDVAPAADRPEGPATHVANRERHEILRSCLELLSDRFRDVIRMRHEEEATWSEVADRLGCPSTDAARMLYARAKVELGKALASRGGR